ncbi:hypothetical protein JEM65_01950 [Gelidibacter salicanalis]|uniref:Carboxypeptidase-like regulatory domain-containing protein n=1 Tax=Gelidibacter salicanalis TaxID=291193 RepID=A0A934NGC3_9FLAO|nr:hypothetical protein [Gelidibacter salicanalis]
MLLSLLCATFSFSQTKITDAQSQYPVSYATVSFNNGNGLFANDEGEFIFTKKLYPDIDTLYISALGYQDLKIATMNLPTAIQMQTETNALDEVLITAKTDRKFKVEDIKPYLDDDYYHCWLPTVESEIAVYFNNPDEAQKKITKVYFPITLESKDWERRKRSNADKKPFSTLFKVKFYTNQNGYPGQEIIYKTLVVRATEKDGDAVIFDVSDEAIFIPQTGIFVSLQVLGYTDANGKLLSNKKYKEIKSRGGSVVKIPTNFRPLLPFTDKISQNRTYIKRVFVNGNKWTRFEAGSDFQSTLLQSGLNNYGMGLTYNVYKD